jgi:formate hydrogenlyase subunit 3/multisubunit Na+/H+ antiporter MnhD subunit
MHMNIMLVKALLALALVGAMAVGLAIALSRQMTVPLLLQLVGAACLVVVVLTHICEALHLFPRMQWGEERGIGHYLDLVSAVFGLTLFPLGYCCSVVTKRRA